MFFNVVYSFVHTLNPFRMTAPFLFDMPIIQNIPVYILAFSGQRLRDPFSKNTRTL